MLEPTDRGSDPPTANLRGWRPFHPDLEAAFRRMQAQRYLPRTRGVITLSALIFLGFAFQSLAMHPAPISRFSFAVQAFVIAPGTVLCVLLTYTSWGRQRIPALAATALTIATGGLIVAIYFAHVRGYFSYPYEGLLLIVLGAHILLELPLVWLVLFGIITTGGFLAAEWLAGVPNPQWALSGFYLASASLIGLVGRGSQLAIERRDFLSERALHDESNRDGLTGVRNRRFFDTQFPLLWAQARRDRRLIAIAFFDVDHFKAYNDGLGHLAGDDCLRTIAGTLSTYARRPLDAVVRYGGEEFLVLWYGVDSVTEARRRAEAARAAVAEIALPHPDSSVGPYVTVSCGVATALPAPNTEPWPLVALADHAMYDAKRRGRNQVRMAE